MHTRNRGVSLEEELWSILTAAVDAYREVLIREAEVIARRARRISPDQHTDSARTMREEWDAWG